MSGAAAPFHHALAEGPDGADARWLVARDGVRLRAVTWPHGPRGTVLLFHGRSEYIEKYGRVAGALAARGYATATLDWRGQGLSDRSLPNLLTGHVNRFGDYQHDVAALTAHVAELESPRPWWLLAHSMGGAIGLRALHEGLDVGAAAFSAPMWGIVMPRTLRPVAWGLAWTGRQLGFGHRHAPGTRGHDAPLDFETNLLTTDAETYTYTTRQVALAPDLAVGAPSLHWLLEALVETRALRRMPPPDLPALCTMGTDEQIVDPASIRQVVAAWPRARLQVAEGARHEVMMERPAVREAFLDDAAALFEQARTETAGQGTVSRR